MLLAKGFIHAALPLALAVAGGGWMVHVADMQQRTTEQYSATRHDVRAALHLDWQPASNSPRTAGEIACWQQRDSSIRSAELMSDYQGNIYVQDPRTSGLRVLRFEPGFKLSRADSDWMNDKLIDQTRSAGQLP
jgi:hypothetical protein